MIYKALTVATVLVFLAVVCISIVDMCITIMSEEHSNYDMEED